MLVPAIAAMLTLGAVGFLVGYRSTHPHQVAIGIAGLVGGLVAFLVVNRVAMTVLLLAGRRKR